VTDTQGFRHISERPRYDAGFFQLVTGTFVAPDGFSFERSIVRHPGAVCIAALSNDDSSVIAVSQYRAAIDRLLLELPAGKRDKADEPPLLCAQRELIEETGFLAEKWTRLGSVYNSPGFTDEETILYLAEDLNLTNRATEGIEEKYMTVEKIELADYDKLLDEGKLVDAKTIIAIGLVKKYLAETKGRVF